MARIDSCPENSSTATEASRKLGCANDEYGNNQYLCLPNVNLSSLVEFCYEGIMGLQENGMIFNFILSYNFNISLIYFCFLQFF